MLSRVRYSLQPVRVPHIIMSKRSKPGTSKNNEPKVEILKKKIINVDLTIETMEELLTNGVITRDGIMEEIEYLMDFRDEWLQNQAAAKAEEPKSSVVESGNVEVYSHPSPRSDTDSDQSSDHSSVGGGSAVPDEENDNSSYSSFSDLMSGYANPESEDRNFTPNEIEAVKKDLKLFLQYGTHREKVGFLKTLKAINSKFGACVSRGSTSTSTKKKQLKLN